MSTKNLRSIDNIVTNDMNFKHLETTKDIVISPKNEYGDPQRPDVSHKWTAKVSDGTNYVGDYAVKISGASMVVDSEDFTKLPVGQYQLEIWEQWNDVDGTSQLSIYPSPQQTIPFTIYANITDQAGKEIKEIGFQDVVDQAVMNIGMNYVFKVNTIEPDQTATVVQAAADGKNYVTFNIPRGAKGDKGDQGPQGPKGDTGSQGPKGDKGDTGTFDNASLTTVPAFVSLNSKIDTIQTNGGGRNLLWGTGTASGDVASDSNGTLVKGAFNGYDAVKTKSAWSERYINLKSALGRTNAKAGDWYTISVYIKADKQIDTGFINAYRALGSVDATAGDGSLGSVSMQDKPITTQWQQYSWSFQINDISLQRQNTRIEYTEDTGDNWIYWAGWMLEKGIVAHDWQPAPEDRGDRGLSIWFNKNAYGGNLQGKWWSDLYNTKVGFGPQVGDLVIQPNGMITQVTAVNASGDAGKGGGTFDTGDVIGNMQGHTPVRGTDYWTDADKNEIKSYVDDAILNGKW